MFATRARKSVENSRLLLDAAKARSKNTGWHLPGQAGNRAEGHDDDTATEEARVEIEQAEDEFVGQTEEAVGVMKNVRSLSSLQLSTKLITNRFLIPPNLSETSQT